MLVALATLSAVGTVRPAGKRGPLSKHSSQSKLLLTPDTSVSHQLVTLQGVLEDFYLRLS